MRRIGLAIALTGCTPPLNVTCTCADLDGLGVCMEVWGPDGSAADALCDDLAVQCAGLPGTFEDGGLCPTQDRRFTCVEPFDASAYVTFSSAVYDLGDGADASPDDLACEDGAFY